MLLKIIVESVLILTVLIGTAVGIKRGFVKTVAKPVRIILSLWVAFSLAVSFSDGIIEPRIGPSVSNQVEEYVLEKCGDITSENVDDELPTLLKIAAAIFDVDIEGRIADDSEASVVSVIVKSLVDPVVHVVSVIISFIILLLISSLLLSLIFWLLSAILDTGVVGVFNRILGGAVLGVFAFFIAWLAASTFTYIINLPSVSALEWARDFEGGAIYRFFNSFNPVELLLSF